VTDELRQVTKTTIGGGDMDNLSREMVVKALELADDASDEDMTTAIKVLKDKVEAGKAWGPETSNIKELEDRIAKQDADILVLQNDKAKEDATLAADMAIRAGRFVPGVRDQLVSLALTNGEEFKKLVDNTPANAILATGMVIGGDGDDAPDLSKYEPAPDQLPFLHQTGVTREEYILERMEESGDTVAEPVRAKLKEAVKASR
jgi:hypothetical protein